MHRLSRPLGMVVKRKAAELALADSKKPKVNGSITAFFGAPKPAAPAATGTAAISTATPTKDADGTTTTAGVAALPATSAPALPKFDKEKWVAKLSEEQRELLQLEIETLDESWLAALKDDVTSKSFLELKRFLKKEKESKQTVFPPEKDIYSWYAPQMSRPPRL